MNYLKRVSLASLLSTCCASGAQAITVWYQPTPYPTKAVIDARGPKTILEESVPHVVDGWITNIYYGQNFVQDDRFQVGGWSDIYRSYIKLDLQGLPQKDVTEAGLFLLPYSRGDGSLSTWTNLSIVNNDWNTGMKWATQPGVTSLGWMPPPTAGVWQGVNITQWYNEWKLKTRFNYGFQMSPWQIDNRFNVFRNSRYSDDGSRPVLALTFTPTLELKLPFDGTGGKKWRVTTEIGGGGCDYIHEGHQGPGYFSIDFSGRAKGSDGTIVTDPDVADVPIIAAARGKVIKVVKHIKINGNPSDGYGNSVVIEHEGTGITTRYSHLKPGSVNPNLIEGKTVEQGTFLGHMGNTGWSTGIHLDFSLRYQGSATKDQEPLTRVVMEGQILKQYQVDGCTNGESNRYYWSSNAMLP